MTEGIRSNMLQMGRRIRNRNRVAGSSIILLNTRPPKKLNPRRLSYV